MENTGFYRGSLEKQHWQVSAVVCWYSPCSENSEWRIVLCGFVYCPIKLGSVICIAPSTRGCCSLCEIKVRLFFCSWIKRINRWMWKHIPWGKVGLLSIGTRSLLCEGFPLIAERGLGLKSSLAVYPGWPLELLQEGLSHVWLYHADVVMHSNLCTILCLQDSRPSLCPLTE